MFRIQRTTIIKVLSTHHMFQCHPQGVIMAPWFHTNRVLGELENATQEEYQNRRMQIKRILARKS